MVSTRFFACTLFAGVLLIGGAPWAAAQGYPNRTVRIVTSEAGGGSDLAARIIAQGIAPGLGQPVLVDNRAGGVIAGDSVAKATPDGHTLLFYGNTLWLLPLMRSSMPYDPAKDFAPITLAIATPQLLVTHVSVPVNSVRELIAYAKSRPGQLNYSTAATGTGNHLAAELFKSMTGIEMVRVGYKGHPSALNAAVAGEVQIFFPVVGPGMVQVKTGKIKALAVTSLQPTPQAPGVPTMTSSGLPGFESIFEAGMFAPAGTPGAVINRLNRDIVQLIQRPDVKEKLLGIGMEAVGNSPQEFANAMKAEVTVMGKVIKDAGIRDE